MDNQLDPHVSLKALDQSWKLDGYPQKGDAEGVGQSYTQVNINIFRNEKGQEADD